MEPLSSNGNSQSYFLYHDTVPFRDQCALQEPPLVPDTIAKRNFSYFSFPISLGSRTFVGGVLDYVVGVQPWFLVTHNLYIVYIVNDTQSRMTGHRKIAEF